MSDKVMDEKEIITLEKEENEDILSNKKTNTTSISSEDNDESELEEAYKKYYLDPSQNTESNYNNYLFNSLKLISFFPKDQNLYTYQLNQKKISIDANLTLTSKGKKTLVLDLDETLIHADVDFKFKYHDEMLKFKTKDNEEILLPLIIRPNLFHFLNWAVKIFDIVVFTASERIYADAILDYIEKDNKYFSKRFYRENCLYLSPGFYLKDLRIFDDMELRDIIIVDNSIFSFANQINNGVLISSFYNDKNDNMLFNVANYLALIQNAEDVREINKQNLQYEQYLSKVSNILKDV